MTIITSIFFINFYFLFKLFIFSFLLILFNRLNVYFFVAIIKSLLLKVLTPNIDFIFDNGVYISFVICSKGLITFFVVFLFSYFFLIFVETLFYVLIYKINLCYDSFSSFSRFPSYKISSFKRYFSISRGDSSIISYYEFLLDFKGLRVEVYVYFNSYYDREFSEMYVKVLGIVSFRSKIAEHVFRSCMVFSSFIFFDIVNKGLVSDNFDIYNLDRKFTNSFVFNFIAITCILVLSKVLDNGLVGFFTDETFDSLYSFILNFFIYSRGLNVLGLDYFSDKNYWTRFGFDKLDFNVEFFFRTLLNSNDSYSFVYSKYELIKGGESSIDIKNGNSDLAIVRGKVKKSVYYFERATETKFYYSNKFSLNCLIFCSKSLNINLGLRHSILNSMSSEDLFVLLSSKQDELVSLLPLNPSFDLVRKMVNSKSTNIVSDRIFYKFFVSYKKKFKEKER